MNSTLEWGLPVEGFTHKECGGKIVVQFAFGDDVARPYGKWVCEVCCLSVMEPDPGGDNSELRKGDPDAKRA